MSKRISVIVEGREYIVEVGDLKESPIIATVNGRSYHVELPPNDATSAKKLEPGSASSIVAKKATPAAQAETSLAITAPLPGNILEIRVKVGDSVNAGDVVFVLEAMKMNNMIHSSHAGVIATVDVVSGQAVDYGTVLATFE